MAKSEQLAGAEENGEEGVTDQDDRLPLRVEGKLTLFDRLGGDPGISNIVADFVVRAMEDPRVNWERAGIERGLLRRVPVVDWEPTAENIAILTKHIAQFLALASGGPARYDGRELETTHADMRITNPEFDAVIGDLKATLDKLKVPSREQKELLAIVESTRPQIVTER
jgi:hemoglobin